MFICLSLLVLQGTSVHTIASCQELTMFSEEYLSMTECGYSPYATFAHRIGDVYLQHVT